MARTIQDAEYKRARIAAPSQGLMDAAVIHSRAEMSDLVDALSAKLIDPAEFVDRMSESLEESHTKAVILGRQRAGDLTAQEWDDRFYARQVVDGQSEFLDHFREDLESGDSRYIDADGNWRGDAILARAQMYSDRITGTANEAFALTSDDDLITWKLGGLEHSCPDCPHYAAGSPYKASELPATPLSGQTACLMRCKCYLVREDGVEGFRGTPAATSS